MTSSTAESSTVRYKRCGTCGFATPSTRTRCHNCWNELDRQQDDLTPEQAAELLQEQGDFAAARALSRARQRRRRWLIAGGLLVAILAWFSWWFYGSFIYTPPPVPAPSNPAVQMPAGPGVWATSNGDLSGTRRAAVSAPLDGTEAWSSSLSAVAVTPAVADEERLYVVLANDRIAALSLEDGSLAWEYHLQGSPLAAPTIADGRLFVALRAGQLLVIDAASGEALLHSLNTGVRFGASPLVADGVVYVFGVGTVVGFDAETAEVLWKTPFSSDFAFANPVLSDGYLAGVTGRDAVMFSRENGAQTYFYEMPRAFPYSIVERDGVFYVSYARFSAAIEDTSRRPWWEGMRAPWFQFWLWGMAPDVPAPPALWQRGQPPVNGYPGALIDDAIVLAGPSGDVVAMRLDDGADAWQLTLDSVTAPPLATPDGVLLAHEGRVALHDAATGALLAEREVTGEPRDLVLTSRGLFLVLAGGTVVAVR